MYVNVTKIKVVVNEIMYEDEVEDETDDDRYDVSLNVVVLKV